MVFILTANLISYFMCSKSQELEATVLGQHSFRGFKEEVEGDDTSELYGRKSFALVSVILPQM